MKVRGICLLAVALVGASACERKEEKPGQTTITSGETKQATPEQPPLQQPPAAQAPEQEPPLQQAQQETQEPGTRGPAATLDDEAKKDECVCPPTATPKKAKKAKVKVTVGTTTTTSAETEGPKTTTTPTEPTRPRGTMQPAPAEPQPEPYVNHSTVLGDGKSGTYTDGQGTYGGRATWGTGTPKK